MKKKTIKTQDIILDIDDLEGTVSEVSPEAMAYLVPIMTLENEETIAEQLVRAGNEEADFEQREAADELE